MKIIAIDPGGTTGIAIATVGRDWLTDIGKTLEVVQYGTPEENYSALRVFQRIFVECQSVRFNIERLPWFESSVCVIEDFRLFPGQIHTPDPNGTLPDRYIARLDMCLYLWKEYGVVVGNRREVATGESRCPTVVKQMPGERVVVTDAYLKTHGLWRKGMPHAMDALRHMVVWCRKNSDQLRSGAL